MEGISSSKHGYFKYMSKEKMHCIHVDASSFNHCILIQVLDPFYIPILFSITILMNNNLNQASSSSQHL